MIFDRNKWYAENGFIPYKCGKEELVFGMELYESWQKRWGHDVVKYLRLPFPRVWLEATNENGHIYCFVFAHTRTRDDLGTLFADTNAPDTIWRQRFDEDDRVYMCSTANITNGTNAECAFIIHPNRVGQAFTLIPLNEQKNKLNPSDPVVPYCVTVFASLVTLLNSPTIADQRRIIPKRRRRDRERLRTEYTEVCLRIGPREAIRRKLNPKKYEGLALHVGGHRRGQWRKDDAGDWVISEIWIDDYIKGDQSKGIKAPKYKI